MNSRRIATAFALATFFVAPTLLAQSQFKFKEVVQTGDAAPVPPQLGSVLEFAFSDQGNVALIAGVVVGMPLGELINAMATTAVVTCLVGAVLGLGGGLTHLIYMSQQNGDNAKPPKPTSGTP